MTTFEQTSSRLDLALTDIYQKKLSLFDTCNEIRKLYDLEQLTLGQFVLMDRQYKESNLKSTNTLLMLVKSPTT